MLSKQIKITPSQISMGKDESRFIWNSLDDKLTGGRSSSLVDQNQSFITYSGEIRNINNSSWSCLRSNRLDQDLSNYEAIKLRVKSDGRPYAFQMEYNEGWQDEKLSCSFKTIPNEWMSIDLKFENFKHIKFGQSLNSKINSAVLNHILRYNFYVAEKIIGPFKIEIESIQFY